MAEPLLYLDQLSGPEALKLLADTAASHKMLDGVGLLIQQGGLRRLVTLIIGDPSRNKRLKPVEESRARCFESLLDGYRSQRGQEPSILEPEGEEIPLAQGICMLVTEKQFHGAQGSPEARDYLIMAGELDEKTALTTLMELSGATTAVRVAASGRQILFHVMDDPQRLSGFQALLASGALQRFSVLVGFQTGRHHLFLDRDCRPDPSSLESFTRLVQAVPELFKLPKNQADVPQKLGIYRTRGDQGGPGLMIWDLSRLEFRDDINLAARPDQMLEFQTGILENDPERLKNLWAQLKQTRQGYRLSLRRIRLRETGERERLRLEEQMAEIRYKLAWLDSTRRARPILLRFGPQQLPALADLLRVMPIDSLNDENLLYGFQASQDQPAGYHYLMFDPARVVLQDLDPLLLWETRDAPNMRFHLDPFWARHYYHQETNALLCVPQGTALTPTIHDWDRQGMDTWLRRLMVQWFNKSGQVDQIPARPIYLFDGRPDQDQTIAITVLDQDRFQPLATRLGWLTDNLVLLQNIDNESFIQAMSTEKTRQLMANDIQAGAWQASVRLEHLAQETSNDMASILEVMTQTLSNELNKVANESFTIVNRIREIRKELREWERAETEMKEFAREIRRHRAALVEKSEENRSRFKEMEDRVINQLNSCRRLRMKLLADISTEVQELRSTREYIRDRMFNLKIWE